MGRGNKPLMARYEVDAVAERYTKLSEFRRQQPRAYTRAKNLGALAEVTKHMERSVPKPAPAQPVFKTLDELLDGTYGRLAMYKTLGLVKEIHTGSRLMPKPFGVCWLYEYWRSGHPNVRRK